MRSPTLFTALLTFCSLWLVFAQSSGYSTEVQTFETKVGPWGKLQCYYFYLEAPENVIARIPLPDTQTRWKVPEPLLRNFELQFAETALAPELIKDLFSPDKCIIRNGLVNLFPSAQLIENLSAAERGKIYSTLATYPDNEFYQYPLFFMGGSVKEWAKDSGLRTGLVQMIEKLAYQRGNALAFSDIPTLINRALSDSEAQFIKKKMTRTRTLIARLELDKDSNVTALLDYWSTGLNLRRKEMEPLMKATAGLPGPQFLDILHLLPALPRKLLYTYPGDEFTTHSRLPDCHWTTLNFFNYQAQNYYLDSELAASAILENFTEVSTPYRFGDILLFIDDRGDAFHSCIYLADDIVYSKNGSNGLLPWGLSQIGDLEKMYNIDIGLGRIQGFRHKEGKYPQSE